jgi:hypothetical protein
MAYFDGVWVQLEEIERELEGVQFRLLGVQATLPSDGRELVAFLKEEPMDASTQIRGVIGCLLEDSIGPAIRDLKALIALGGEG